MPAQPFSEKEFKDIYSKVPRVTVDLVLRSPQGLVLTLRSHYAWHGQWHFPGGTIFYGESVEQTVRRVAREEVGVDVVIRELLGYLEYPSEHKERGFGQAVSLVFLCDTPSRDLAHQSHDASAVRAFRELPEQLIREQKEFLAAHPKWR